MTGWTFETQLLFAGKVITAAYVPLINYHNLFPDAMAATPLLTTNR